jgi:hypothetical protein
MECCFIRVYPYQAIPDQSKLLEEHLAAGWQLHGAPFKGRGDEEYFQAVIKRPGNETPLQEPGRGGSLTKGNPGTISRG